MTDYKGIRIWFIPPHEKGFPDWQFAIHPNGFYRYYSRTRKVMIEYSELKDIKRHIDYFEDTDEVIIKASDSDSVCEKLIAFYEDKRNWGYEGDTARFAMWKVDREARYNRQSDNPQDFLHVLFTGLEHDIYKRAMSND